MKPSPKNLQVVVEAGLGLLLVALSIPALIRAFAATNWRVLISLLILLLAFASVRARQRINALVVAIIARFHVPRRYSTPNLPSTEVHQ
jgi:hypothetical protein